MSNPDKIHLNATVEILALRKEIALLTAKVERLTVDNAVMLDTLQGIRERPRASSNYRRTWQIMGRDHPGQALLDRLAKLTAAAEAARFCRENMYSFGKTTPATFFGDGVSQLDKALAALAQP